MGASSSRAAGGGQRRSGRVLNKDASRDQRRQRQPRRRPAASDAQQPPVRISLRQLDQGAVDQNAASSSDIIQRVDERHAQEESKGTELPLSADKEEEEEEEEEEECAICLEGYSEESPKLLIPCQHHYHFHCMLEWAERSHTCPICERVAIFDGKSSPARVTVA